ncbi:MAG: OmpA family protein, partial [Duncaniella sp.]|nr:OmpA family protein [Duncaniella sp.]
YGLDNKEARNFKAINGEFEKLWSDKRWFLAGRGILGLDINLSSIFAINIEANANMMPDCWNSKNGHNKDWQFNGMIGCTVKFGSNKRIIPAIYEKIVVDVPEPEPRVLSEPTVTTEPKAEVENIEPIKEYVFFLIDSDEIRPEEMVKVDRLVEFMKANSDFRVSVTGYADRETGTGPYNMKLSVKRAHAVADALIHAGIHANRIIVSAEGDKIQPFAPSEYTKNRVAICITEK